MRADNDFAVQGSSYNVIRVTALVLSMILLQSATSSIAQRPPTGDQAWNYIVEHTFHGNNDLTLQGTFLQNYDPGNGECQANISSKCPRTWKLNLTKVEKVDYDDKMSPQITLSCSSCVLYSYYRPRWDTFGIPNNTMHEESKYVSQLQLGVRPDTTYAYRVANAFQLLITQLKQKSHAKDPNDPFS
jgi:hypothetical protein